MVEEYLVAIMLFVFINSILTGFIVFDLHELKKERRRK